MSRAVRKELFSTLETLEKANEILQKILEKGDPEAAMELLTDCQNCAIAIGNRIEAVYGNDLRSIHVLEEYCEGIYQIAENINITERAKNSYTQVCMQLIKAREVMEQDIPDKLEIVFFPYKASMWDSLESVYLAAKEDPDCDAYCVPIPYYDKNSDGSFGAMHYEGDEYPKNIEVTDWQNYDFAIRIPDAIYIHNPYDSCNRVTSVYPKFYSGNLKKYTEELVYIPYFVLPEIEPDDEAAIESIKHFLFLPGIVNADKVIVQSEKMKQIYINEYLKGAKASGLTGTHLDREKLEEKFLGLGSPKFDKVLNTRKEDLEIPEEWLRIIQKPDGTWKKIIFYNTSVTALLRYDMKMLEKMKYVFRVFKEQQEKVALLWRPHPLIPSTIQSMRPHLWKEYEKIVKEYRQESWGIYDDTADMDRAVVLSDEYYGDPSSVVQVYKLTSKKIIIQTPSKYDPYSDLSIETSLLYMNTIYVLSRKGALYCRKKNENVYCYLALISKIWSNYQYRTMVGYRGNLYFFPYYANEIAIYDIESQKVSYIETESSKQKFYKACVCNNQFVFVFGDIQAEEICINLDNMCIQKKYKWKEQIAQELKETVGGYFHKSYPVVVESTFYLPLSKDNYILKYNMDKFEYELLKVGDKKIKYSSMCFKNGIMWLFGDDNFITLWHLKTNQVKYLAISNDTISIKNECAWRDLFSKCVLVGNYIYLFPLSANEIIKVNCDDFNVEQVYSLQEKSVILSAEEIIADELYFCEEILPIGNAMNNNYLLCPEDEVKINPIEKRILNEEYQIVTSR